MIHDWKAANGAEDTDDFARFLGSNPASSESAGNRPGIGQSDTLTVRSDERVRGSRSPG